MAMEKNWDYSNKVEEFHVFKRERVLRSSTANEVSASTEGTMELLNLLIDAIRLSIGGACIITAIVSGLVGLVAGIAGVVDNQNTKRQTIFWQ